MAHIAGHGRHKALELHLGEIGRGLVISAAHDVANALVNFGIKAVVEHAAHIRVQRFVVAVKHNFLYFLGKVFEGHGERKPVFFRQGAHHGGVHLTGVEAPAFDVHRAFGKRLVPLDELVEIGDHAEAQPETFRTRSVRRVKGEKARGQFFHGDVAVGAGIFCGIERVLLAVHAFRQAVGEFERGLQAVRQTARHALFDDQPVHDDRDGMLDVLVQISPFRAVVIANAVHFDTHITALSQAFEQLGKFAFPAAHDGRDYHYPAPLGQRRYLVGYLIDRLPDYFLAALGTMGNADTRIEQTQIVIYLRDRAHGRARIVRSRLLIYGYGGGKPLDIVHVGLVHLSQKLPRVRGKRFHISALTFRKKRVEGERRFSRTAQPREHDELVARNGHVDIFEIVHPCAFDDYLILHITFSSCSPTFSSRRRSPRGT